MDSTNSASTPLSAKERLRQIRERRLGNTPEQNSADRGESLPVEYNVTAPSLSAEHGGLEGFQAAVPEISEPVEIPSPSLAFEPVDFLPKDIDSATHLDQSHQTGQSSSTPLLELDPVAAFVRNPSQMSAEYSLSFEQSLAQRPIETHIVIEQP
ncbi:hypothetical protein Micbo1qcDRAFT_161300, partial [Microdochium bolleyi]